MIIKEVLRSFAEFCESIRKAESVNDVRNAWFDDPDLDEAVDEAQAVLDKGLTCDTCKYNQNDPTDGRPCTCLTCALSYLTPEQQKNGINYEAR